MEADRITIKPHHFLDIIKLYGAGIEDFVPDEKFQHDFYRVANEVTKNPECRLQFTVYGDDICKPCNRFNGSRCTDLLDGVKGYHDKESYNRALDARLMHLLKLNTSREYSVKQVLEYLKSQGDIIFKVWLEEDPALTKRRNALFQKGLDKLGDKWDIN